MDTRTILIIFILGFTTAGILNSLYFGLELKRYVARTQVLDSSLAILRYKKMVANQMRAALVQIVLLATPVIAFVAGMMLEWFHGTDLFIVIIPSLVIVAIALYFRGWEMMARSIPATDPEIEEERDAIVRTWLRKALPDW
jgi:protein-S-isoprenylcysteine O-methyltransferase Ste14